MLYIFRLIYAVYIVLNTKNTNNTYMLLMLPDICIICFFFHPSGSSYTTHLSDLLCLLLGRTLAAAAAQDLGHGMDPLVVGPIVPDPSAQRAVR